VKYPQYIVARYGREVFRSDNQLIAGAWKDKDQSIWPSANHKVVTRKEPIKADIIRSLDKFTRAYIETALWSSHDNSNEQGGEPLDRNYSTEDLSLDCLKRMIADCNQFRALVSGHLAICPGSDEQNGHDFWLTRNHHGVGFWARGYKEPIGKVLTNCAQQSFGECSLYAQRGKVGIE